MHCYAIIPSQPISPHGPCQPGEEELARMREGAQRWPNVRWAATQNLELDYNVGHLKFVAVGPENTIPCITQPFPFHWAYQFVGFVNLLTGTIEHHQP